MSIDLRFKGFMVNPHRFVNVDRSQLDFLIANTPCFPPFDVSFSTALSGLMHLTDREI
jgi:hypothetical protein